MRRSLLDRHLFREVVAHLTFGVALFTTILVAIRELQVLTIMVVVNGVSLWTAIRIFGLSVPFYMSLAFPMSMLLSTLLAFSRLSSDSETVGMLAAGASFYRMARPIAVIGVLVSLLTIGFDEIIAPRATSEKNQLYAAAMVAGVVSDRPFHPDKISWGVGSMYLYADNYDTVTKKLARPTLVFYDNNGKPLAIEWAERGTWHGGGNWDFDNGFIQKIGPDAPAYSVSFSHQRTSLNATLEQLLVSGQDANGLTFTQLRARIAQKRAEHRSMTDIDTDLLMLYSKISIPFASLVFAFIGFPLGIRRQRSSSALGFALSIGIIFMYYLVYQYASILGGNGTLPPLLCAWIPNILGMIVGLVLLRQVSS